jgi:hypothetical protein
MTLIVSNRPNAGYNGKQKARATALVKSGTRVGMCWVGGAETKFFCHVCSKDQPYPKEADADFQHGIGNREKIDVIADCPGCKTPFVFAEI